VLGAPPVPLDELEAVADAEEAAPPEPAARPSFSALRARPVGIPRLHGSAAGYKAKRRQK